MSSSLRIIAGLKQEFVGALRDLDAAKATALVSVCADAMSDVDTNSLHSFHPGVVVTAILAHHTSCVLPYDKNASDVFNRFWDVLAGLGERSVYHKSVCHAIRSSCLANIMLDSLPVDPHKEHVKDSWTRIIPVLLHAYYSDGEINKHSVEILMFVERVTTHAPWVVSDVLVARSNAVLLRGLVRLLVGFMRRRRFTFCSVATSALYNMICRAEAVAMLEQEGLVGDMLDVARDVVPHNCTMASSALQCYLRCLQVAKDVEGGRLLASIREAFVPRARALMDAVMTNGLFHMGLATRLMHVAMYFLGTIVNFPESPAPPNVDVVCADALKFGTTAYNLCAFPSEAMESILYFTFDQVLCLNTIDDCLMMEAMLDALHGMWKVAGIHEKPRCSHVYLLMKFLSKNVPEWLRQRIVLDIAYIRLVDRLCSGFQRMDVCIVACGVSPSLIGKVHIQKILINTLLKAEDVFAVDTITRDDNDDEEDKDDDQTQTEFMKTPPKFRRGTGALVFVQSALKSINTATLQMVLGCSALWKFVGTVMSEARPKDVAYAVCTTLVRDLVDVTDCPASKALLPAFCDAMRSALSHMVGPGTKDKPTRLAARSIAMVASVHADALMEVHKMQMFERFVKLATSTMQASHR